MAHSIMLILFPGTSLEVQWLRLLLKNAGGAGSISGWGAKILHASQPKTKAENRSSIVTHLIKTLTIILQ